MQQAWRALDNRVVDSECVGAMSPLPSSLCPFLSTKRDLQHDKSQKRMITVASNMGLEFVDNERLANTLRHAAVECAVKPVFFSLSDYPNESCFVLDG